MIYHDTQAVAFLLLSAEVNDITNLYKQESVSVPFYSLHLTNIFSFAEDVCDNTIKTISSIFLSIHNTSHCLVITELGFFLQGLQYNFT